LESEISLITNESTGQNSFGNLELQLFRSSQTEAPPPPLQRLKLNERTYSSKIEGRDENIPASWTQFLRMAIVARKGGSFGGKVAAFRVAGIPFPLLLLPQRT